MIILIYIIIILGIYLSLKKPYYYVILYGLIGSETGARGISGFCETFFPNYTLIMRILLVIAVFISLLHYKKKYNKIIKTWIVLSIWLIITMIVMLTIDIANLSPLSYLSRVTLAIAPFGPGIFIIWLAYADDINHKRLLFTYSVCQCLIAISIIYGSYLGFPFLNVINAGLYSDEYFYLDENNNMVAMPSNFYLAFLGKNEHFIRCGQFHNANGLGFASGMLITLLISGIINNKNKLYRIIYVFSLLVAFLLWCNTGTRGPLIGLFLALTLYVLLHKSNSTTKILTMLCVISLSLILLFAGSNVINYFFGSGASGSWASRSTLNQNTFENLNEFFFFGTAGNLDALHARDIDPHELPLRVLCMYGIIPSILITILTILKPLKKIIIYRKYLSFYSLGIFLTILMVSLTNNYAENSLYWISLGEFVIMINHVKQKSAKNFYGS